MLRSFAGFMYGVALVVASVAVGTRGDGFVTFFGVVAAPFSFFAVAADKIGYVAIPLFWATIAFMARSRRATSTFLALIGLHYVAAIVWLILRRSDVNANVATVHTMTDVAIGAFLIYIAGQVVIWADFARRS